MLKELEFEINYVTWERVWRPMFETNKKFNNLFNKKFDNKAFHIFGISYVHEFKLNKINLNQLKFKIIDPRIWMLAKIKYGI